MSEPGLAFRLAGHVREDAVDGIRKLFDKALHAGIVHETIASLVRMPLAAAIGADLRVGRDAALEYDPVEPAPFRKALDVSLGPDRLLPKPLVELQVVFET